MIYWEDMSVGQTFNTGTVTLTANDIIEYAKAFDPQPYHLDPVFAEQSIFGGHCASGWHMCALMMRLFVDTMHKEGISSHGLSGVDSLRWFMPVFANDSLSALITITDCKLSDEHNGYGVCDCNIDVCNQHGNCVIKLKTNVLIKCKRTEQSNV